MRSHARPFPPVPLPRLWLSWSRLESQGLPKESTEKAASPQLLRSPSRFLQLRSPALPPALEDLQLVLRLLTGAALGTTPVPESEAAPAPVSPHCKKSTGQSRAKLTAPVCPGRARWLDLMLCQDQINTMINETLSPPHAVSSLIEDLIYEVSCLRHFKSRLLLAILSML